jgi:hypothetical protein
MDYLFVKLFVYVALAFAAGLLAGWTSCSRAND